jgi:hypothetical protein
MKQDTRAHRLAMFFHERPNRWIDGRMLAPIAGSYAWRTRISDLRRAPFYMVIENRLRSIDTDEGHVTVSEYRYTPPATAEGVSLF